MASRQEEKEARRKARLEAEQAAARTAARQRRIQLVAGGLLAAVLVVGVVVLLVSGSGGNGDPEAPDEANLPTLPAVQIGDLEPAVKASGCVATSPAIEGSEHEQRDFTAADYKTNPPTSGTHFPEWAQDGVYAPGTEPQLGQLVHTLEHGRIDVQYKPGTPQQVVDQLRAFVAENDGYHMVMFQNPTGMDAQVAFTTWGQSLTCDQVTDKTWDAARAFRDSYIDKGPETVP
jgi:hypothetical protein